MAALATLAALSCLSDRTAGPTSGTVALQLHATVHGLGAAQARDPSIRIHVAYQRDSGALIQLPSEPQGISITPGVTTQAVLVDIAPCLADPQHAPLGARGCNLSVALVLLVGDVVADSENESANQMVGPGTTLSLASITLTAPTSVVLDSHVAQLFASGAPLALSAAVYDSTLLLVGHPVIWTSSTPAVASVTPVGPDSVIVRPLTAGSTVIKASTGDVSDSALITVTATTGTVRIGLSRTAIQAVYALSLHTNPAAPVITVTDSGTASLSLLSLGTVVYAPAGGPKGWLSAALSATTAPTNLTISLTPNKLAVPPPVGTYTASFHVSSPLASNSPRTVVVTLVVTAGPSAVINLSQAAVTDTYPLSLRTNPSPSVISVTDGGALPLTGLSLSAVTYGGGLKGWLTASLSGTTAPANITVSATPNQLAAPPAVGTYTASFTVASPVASNSPQTIVVTLVVTAGPSAVINLSQAAVTDTYPLSLRTNPSPSVINVTDGGALPLTGLSLSAVTYGGGLKGWLTASLSGTTAPANITVSATPNQLAAPPAVGTYTASFTVASPVASNSPQTIVVTLVVTPGPSAVINLSQAAVTDTFALSLGTNPSPSVINVTDGGALPLTGLALGAVTYSPGLTDWLSAKLGNTAAPTNITVLATPANLPVVPRVGTYTATFTVASAVASNSPRTIVVTLVVTPGPSSTIDLSATGASEQLTLVGNDPPARKIAVTDGGQLPLTGLAVGAPTYLPAALGGWLNVGVGANAPTNVTMTPDPVEAGLTLSAGTYTATFQVSAPNSTNSPRTIVDTMIVTPPVIGLSATGLIDTVFDGSIDAPGQWSLTLTDSGGAPLTGLALSDPVYGPQAPAWLSVQLVPPTFVGALPTILLAVDQAATQLGSGTYTAAVRVTAAGAAPRTITVTLVVEIVIEEKRR